MTMQPESSSPPPPWRVVGVCVLLLACGVVALVEAGSLGGGVIVSAMMVASRVIRSWAP